MGDVSSGAGGEGGDVSVLDGDGVPRWVVVTTFVLAFLGLGLSIYLAFEHFTSSTTLACSNTPGIDCAKVTTSKYSYFLGIPVSVLGLCQYVAMVALCSPQGWRARRREVHVVRLVLAAAGMAFVLWLITAEVLFINAICLWCTGVHLVTFALFILVVLWVPRLLGWTER
jgi:uncharacterized membrane protein